MMGRIAMVIVFLFPTASYAALITRVEEFDTDPGWAVVGTGVNGNDFGYQATSSYAGGMTGEAGGIFTRTEDVRQYADTNLGGSIDLSMPFLGSGLFTYTAQNRPDFGRPLIVGHFSTSGISTINVTDMVGIGIDNGGTIDEIYWTGVVILADGTDLSILPKTLLSVPDVSHTWSYEWNPTGGVSGDGAFTFNLDGMIQEVELTAAQRAIGFSADAFGFGGGPAPAGADNGWYADVYIDNVNYSTVSAVPEPSTFLIVAIGIVIVVGVRHYRGKRTFD